MIYYVTAERFGSSVRRMLRRGDRSLRRIITPLSYEELFFERAAPIGHYIFTDFDRLTAYELETVAQVARILTARVPGARIYNDPVKVLQRLPLLQALHKAGINDFTAIRLEGDARPARYPVFIRLEDGFAGPETALIHDAAAFDAALAELDRRALPRRGRIAIGYAAEPGPDGLFRKYGAFNFSGRIVPYHLQRNDSWVVKRHLTRDGGVVRSQTDYHAAGAVDEERQFLQDNPHADVLARAFAIAGIDYGRADYGIVGGRVQIYEINTNPHLPGAAAASSRSQLRQLRLGPMSAGFAAMNPPLPVRGRIAFADIRPRAHDVHLPRVRLPVSVVRRALDRLRGIRP